MKFSAKVAAPVRNTLCDRTTPSRSLRPNVGRNLTGFFSTHVKASANPSTVNVNSFKNSTVPTDVNWVLRRLQRVAGDNVFLVGEPVRNGLVSRPVRKYVFATQAKPHEVAGMFTDAVKTQREFGRITIPRPTGTPFEIISMHEPGLHGADEKGYRVKFTSELRRAAEARDFTVDAIYWNPITGAVFDFFEGVRDLEARNLRTPGDPSLHIRNNPLMPIRACRLAAQDGFSVDRSLLAALPQQMESIRSISQAQFLSEFLKILATPKPSIAIELLRQMGILKIFLPEFLACVDCDQGPAHEYDVYKHLLKTADYIAARDVSVLLERSEEPLAENSIALKMWKAPCTPEERAKEVWVALLHDLGKPPKREPKEGLGTDGKVHFYDHAPKGAEMTEALMRRLGFPKEWIEFTIPLVRYHMWTYEPEPKKGSNATTDATVRRLRHNVGADRMAAILRLRLADRLAKNASGVHWYGDVDALYRHMERLDLPPPEVFKLAIDGEVVMKELGLKPGAAVGHILHYLNKWALGNPAGRNNPEVLLAELHKLQEVRTDLVSALANLKRP